MNTLASLRAVRWIGPAKPEDGLDKPAVVVTFKTSGNVTGKITVGAVVDEMWRATAEGFAGVFAMSRPDEGALGLPLIDKPAAPASPAQPAAAAKPALPPVVPEPSPTPPPPDL